MGKTVVLNLGLPHYAWVGDRVVLGLGSKV